MSRLQKKCFIGASGMHLLLLVILIIGPAFLAPSKVDDTPLLDVIPSKTIDEMLSGGGNPIPRPAVQPIPQQPPPQPQPQVQPPAPQPQPQPVRQPEPPKVETPKINKPDPDSLDPKPDKKPPHKVQVSDTVVKIPKDRKPTTTATAANQAEARATAERRRYADAAKAIKAGLSQTTTVEMPQGGFGGGGVSYANYAQTVRKIYTDAWIIPDDVTDDEATVKVSVTIKSDGTVLTSRIIQPSGSRLVDNSIQATLNRVTFVARFPEGAKESQRTFTISFNLKAKKLLG